MRIALLAATAALSFGAAAQAAPASVTVDVAPALQKTFERDYGVREAALLTQDLQESVERALARTGAYADARIELTLVDAKPNRPTFKQLGDKLGLSMESYGVGGASIEGRIVSADGSVTPVGYKWFESDIREAYGSWIWSDAEWTFDRFARRLSEGQVLAAR